MKHIPCSVVTDLCCAYQDDIVQPDTKQAIELHLADCSHCQAFYKNALQNTKESNQAETDKEHLFQKKLVRFRQLMRLAGAAAIVLSVTVSAAIIMFFSLFLFGGLPDTTAKTDCYETSLQKYDNLQTGLMIFPKTLPECEQSPEFYFFYKDTWNTPACEIYLQCNYDKEMFETEQKRLQELKKVYNGQTNTLLDKQDYFSYPSYVTIFGDNHGYEYALVTGEQQITYIYIANRAQRQIHFNHDYLPNDYQKLDTVTYTNAFSGESMYMVGKDYYNGEFLGYRYDYTRDVYVKE